MKPTIFPKCWILSSLVGGYLAIAPSAMAQIVPDATLPQPTTVFTDGNTLIIEGGTVRGNNLFHSFDQFSVLTGETAFFKHNLTLENIFSRITGGTPSNIDGILQTNGPANLFLINSNGIIFGPNAQLQIGGSFLATTANGIEFADGSIFSTDIAATPPLLTISIPTQLQFANNTGRIVNQSQATLEQFPLNSIGVPLGLAVFPGQSLGLVGGEVLLNNGNLAAFEGNIEIGGVVNGSVNLIPSPSGFTLDYQEITQPGSIQIVNNSVVDASSLPPDFPNSRGGGGGIQVRGDRLLVENSGITSSTYGSASGQDIKIQANQIEMRGFLLFPTPPDSPPNAFAAGIFNQTEGAGNAGDLTLETNRLTLTDGAQILTSTYSGGRGGNLEITANEIEISGFSPLGPSSLFSGVEFRRINPIPATGTAGNITINSDRLILRDGATISAATSAFGNSGTVTINNTGLLEMTGGATNPRGQFSPTRIATFVAPIATGQAGNVNVSTGRLLVGDRAEITAITQGEVPGGNVIINAENLTLQEGGQISVSTQAFGSGGTLTVNVSENLEIIGTDSTGFASGLFSQSQPFAEVNPNSPDPILNFNTGGNAGDIIVSANRVILREGGAISADTFTDGQGGSVTLETSQLDISGKSNFPPLQSLPTQDADGLLPSRITVTTTGPGNAGTLNIAAEQVNISDGAKVSVDARFGGGSAGNLQVTSSEFNLNSGRFSAETASGEGGNIQLQAETILMREGSQISTTAGTANLPGSGGNIDINTEIIAALENSNISANAFDGSGGAIAIDAEALFGLTARTRSELETLLNTDLTQFDPSLDLPNTSDITAISRTDPALSGQIDLNTPDIDPSRGVVALDNNIVDVSGLIDRDPCRIVENSQFLQTGKGGIPPSPTDTLTPSNTWEDWRFLERDTPRNSSGETIQNENQPQAMPKIAATGIRISDRGEVELIGSEPAIATLSPLSGGCLSAQQSKTLAENSTTSETLTIERLEVQNSTAIPPEQLATLTASYRDRTLTFTELQEAAAAISLWYQQQGYMGSGAFIPPQIVRNGVVAIQVVENRLENIEITGSNRLNHSYRSYIRSRLGLQPGDLVNPEKLLESLYLLQFDPRLETLSAELSTGIAPDTSLLSVRVESARFLTPQFTIDNGRSPSVGSLRRQAQLTQYNLLGLGDIASFNYANTDGSQAIDLSYAVPLTANNNTLSFRYSTGDSEIIEPPFNRVDIEANSRTYELSYRHPLIQQITPKNPEASIINATDLIRTEFALGLTASQRESETSLLGVKFPLSPGANENGETRVSALRFFQDALRQDSRQIFAARSEFSLGLSAFDATTNDNGPDSQFFSWRGQTQWVRRIGEAQPGPRINPLLIVRGDLQLATTSLLPIEQYSVGGFNSVRGYRQDALLVDNGAFASVEFQYPVLQLPQWRTSLQIIPFADLGVGWNWDSDNRPNPDQNTLVSTGLGVQLQVSDALQARLDWGIPLVKIDSKDRTWQENGLYFSVRWNPF
ncbi:filamentous hemagglutinin N-terminal domain-containing protein [Laspinema sp. A4]|uniref:two-partner secretion domain-containing protein n=1 Tax=Laspinema sp. D2d TaxID=2953686 RepID=UPI0021BBB520|nr:filamentous hemagglutinin N-terminal domain-containing protein [Laspinema sp. D2d]MCT7982228.1 filamentous hemagglutinin N-terminal domain-containing protein [Laspinema sp. D2d]